MSGYMQFIISRALADDPDARIYDRWLWVGEAMETYIEWSNGVVSQFVTYVVAR